MDIRPRRYLLDAKTTPQAHRISGTNPRTYLQFEGDGRVRDGAWGKYGNWSGDGSCKVDGDWLNWDPAAAAGTIKCERYEIEYSEGGETVTVFYSDKLRLLFKLER